MRGVLWQDELHERAGPRFLHAGLQPVWWEHQKGGHSVQGHVITWASRDRVHQRRAVANPFNVGDVSLGRVITWEQGFVGLTHEAGETVVWSSPDGLSWTRVGSDDLFGGTAWVTSATGFRGGVAGVGSFALHPQPACSATSTPGGLRMFSPATLLWAPERSRSAPPSRLTHPQTLKLLPGDLPPSLQPAFYSSTDQEAYAPAYQSAYVNLCAEDPALGRSGLWTRSTRPFPGCLTGTPLQMSPSSPVNSPESWSPYIP